MRIEHYDTPRSKLKLNKVTDKLYRALKAAQCPDLINEELANKINNLSIKVQYHIAVITFYSQDLHYKNKLV
jgi:hypothetical protein